MTFDQIVSRVCSRMNLTSAEAIARVGVDVNERYQDVTSTIGLNTSVNVIADGPIVAGSRFVTFDDVVKVYSVFDSRAQVITTLTSVSTTATATLVDHGYSDGQLVTIAGADQDEYNGNYAITVVDADTFTYTFDGSGTSPATGTIIVRLQQPARILGEISLDEMRNRVTINQTPHDYAIYRMGPNSVTIMLDVIPTAAAYLSADAEELADVLSGTDEPAFAENFHDILVLGAKATEYEKMEKENFFKLNEAKYEKRLGDLRYFIAKSAYMRIQQNKNKRRRTLGLGIVS